MENAICVYARGSFWASMKYFDGRLCHVFAGIVA
jgi:hypothetical protein